MHFPKPRPAAVARQFVATILIVTAPPLLAAQDDIPTTSGFGGTFLVGTGVFQGRSNMISSGPPLLAPISLERIPNLVDVPEAVAALGLLVGGELNYSLASSRTQFFLGAKLEDLLRLDAALGVGVRQRLPDNSILTVNAFVTPMQVRIWVDPYVENLPRESMRVGFPGFRVRWGGILGTGLALQFTDRFWRLPQELSGQWLASEGRLDAADLPLLDRRGDAWDLQASYRLPAVAKRHRFEPGLAYSRDDFDGAAMANQGGSVRLRYRYLAPTVLVDAYVGYGRRRADEVHPIYGERLTSDRFGFALGVFIPVEIRGARGWSLFSAAESLTEDVNVDFFDSRLTAFTLGIAWRSLRQ